ncbi:hypothetical protein UAJ10_27880 [Nitrospirillum sp. BR 11164]|uniref:hypothetical protein n=1 Tax=Nitrospirillum sp. BR 11164 TaxID=3104324 RepID=UPI002AFE68D6|nr:hypothetical protein [Nitrospirillum sp. BR 11164]MEA1652822.1 hypothetical protein [Nitrospirillum sp. BR 11164]
MIEQHRSDQWEMSDATLRPPALIDGALLDQLRKTLVSVTQPWWRGERVSENGLIYGVNIAGSRPPLVWCFQGYEEFAALAGALGADQPLYGMRSGHLVVGTSAEAHMHMAVAYAAEVHSLGLSGPLFLGGNCQGALLAQKMAQILMVSGRAVSLLFGLNPFLFTPYPGRAAIIVGRYDCTNPFHRLHEADALLRANMPHSTIDTLPSEHGKLFSGKVLGLWSDILRRRMDEALGTFPGSFPDWSLRAEVTAPSLMTVPPGGLCDVPITLRNTSDVTWAPTKQSGLSVGNHWRNADGEILQWLDGRQSFECYLRRGDSVDLVLLVRAPGKEGEYVLEIDVEQAGIMWLSEIGVQTALCRVTVSAAA